MNKREKIKILKDRVAAWKAANPQPPLTGDAWYIGVWCADYDDMTIRLAESLGLDLEVAFKYC
jgi:hypothetical protein